MVKLLILYCFHRIDSWSLKNLINLTKNNPDSVIIPFFGVTQRLFLPILTDFHFLRSFPSRRFQRKIIWPFLNSTTVYQASHKITEVLESFIRKRELEHLRALLKNYDLDLYLDFTPLGYYNQDLAILNWFKINGKDLNFSHLIFYEYDIFSNSSLEEIYKPYLKYDAAFRKFGIPEPNWAWNYTLPGFKKKMASLMKSIKLNYSDKKLRNGLFAGCCIKKRVLSKINNLNVNRKLTYGFCECRMPTLINNLGFNCTSLNFPLVNFRPIINWETIWKNKNQHIYHPYYGS